MAESIIIYGTNHKSEICNIWWYSIVFVREERELVQQKLLDTFPFSKRWTSVVKYLLNSAFGDELCARRGGKGSGLFLNCWTKLHIVVLWILTPCISVSVRQLLGLTQRILLQDVKKLGSSFRNISYENERKQDISLQKTRVIHWSKILLNVRCKRKVLEIPVG